MAVCMFSSRFRSLPCGGRVHLSMLSVVTPYMCSRRTVGRGPASSLPIRERLATDWGSDNKRLHKMRALSRRPRARSASFTPSTCHGMHVLLMVYSTRKLPMTRTTEQRANYA